MCCVKIEFELLQMKHYIQADSQPPTKKMKKDDSKTDTVVADAPYNGRQTVENITVNVLYKTDDIIVIDKPYDVHIDGKHQITIEKLVNSMYPEMSRHDSQEKRKLKFAHQLDYATSGILCLAFTRKSCASISVCFQDRKAEKTYLAVLYGNINKNEVSISAPIAEDKTDLSGFRMCIDKSGKESETVLQVVARGKFIANGEKKDVTKVLLKPKSGRRHQLRLHTKHIGHPIVGDATYADCIVAPRMMLHAYRLVLPLKTKRLDLEAKDPFSSLDCFEWNE
jgi:RluA family pseudouridine synthase